MYRRAMESLPGGRIPFPAWGDDTVYVDRGKGGTVWDIDATSTSTSGWATDRSSSATATIASTTTSERMRKGVSFSLTSEDEVQTIELIKELTGWVRRPG